LTQELDEMVESHGDERLSEIDPMPLSMDREDLVAEEAIVISLTTDNYIRHLPVEAFRLQNRGGKGLKGVATKDEDAPSKIVTCFSKDRLLIFTDKGRVYGLRAWETPSASRYGKGSHIRNLLEGIRDDEKVISILPMERSLIENPEGHFLMFATANGRIKKSKLSEYSKINRNGKFALKFADGDSDNLVSVRPATDADHVVLVSASGNACRFMPSEEKTRMSPETGEAVTTYVVRVQGRISQGVSGMKLAKGDRVIGMIVTDDFDTSVLTISKYGMAKRSRLGSGEMIPLAEEGVAIVDETGDQIFERDGYRKTNRGTKGVRTMSLRDGDEIVSVRQIPDLEDQLFMLTGSGMMIRMVSGQTKETLGKVTKGTRIMELRNRDRTGYVDEIVFVARLPSELISTVESLGEDE
jgi:DNA gyrase subunit A